jgi:hypothetical protein
MITILAGLFAIAALFVSVGITLVVVRRKELAIEELIYKLNTENTKKMLALTSQEVQPIIAEKIAELVKENQAAKAEIIALTAKIEALETSAVNSQEALQNLIESLLMRIKTLETIPTNKYEIDFAAEDFAQLLKGNSILLKMLRDKLHIDKLNATVLSVLPTRLEMTNLDQLHLEATKHYWHLFQVNYLPAFKAEIKQEIEDSFYNNGAGNSLKNNNKNGRAK